MGRHSAAFLWLVVTGLAILPGCVIVPTPGGDPPVRPAAVRRAGESFATHRTITRPGEVVRPNAAAAAAAPSPGPANPIPDPPAPLTTTLVVSPPAPTERVAQATPPPPDPPLVAAVRAYLENRPDRAVEHLRKLDPANQELLIRLIPAVAHAERANLGDPADAADLAAKTDVAADAVARVAPLRLPKACFVESVKQFGVYAALPPGYAYLPGGTAVLYVELHNAPSDPTPHPGGGDGYVTRLNCELQLHDSTGKLLARYDPGNVRDMAVNDFTRSRLRDVFLRFQFQVPSTPGAYRAEFAVQDPATGRSARKAVEFRVAGP